MCPHTPSLSNTNLLNSGLGGSRPLRRGRRKPLRLQIKRGGGAQHPVARVSDTTDLPSLSPPPNLVLLFYRPRTSAPTPPPRPCCSRFGHLVVSTLTTLGPCRSPLLCLLAPGATTQCGCPSVRRCPRDLPLGAVAFIWHCLASHGRRARSAPSSPKAGP